MEANADQMTLFPDDGKRDERPIIGWTKSFWHKTAKKRIVAAPGHAFPIRGKKT